MISFPRFDFRLQQDLAEKEAELQEASRVVGKKGFAEAQRLKEQFALTEAANAELQKEVRSGTVEKGVHMYMYV